MTEFCMDSNVTFPNGQTFVMQLLLEITFQQATLQDEMIIKTRLALLMSLVFVFFLSTFSSKARDY